MYCSVALAGLITFLHASFDMKSVILGKYHYVMYILVLAMQVTFPILSTGCKHANLRTIQFCELIVRIISFIYNQAVLTVFLLLSLYILCFVVDDSLGC